MKLSDFKDEKAIEVVADLLEPIGRIAMNEKVRENRTDDKLKFASLLLKENKKEVLAILAILNGQKPEEYHCNFAEVLKGVMELLNDEDFQALFF